MLDDLQHFLGLNRQIDPASIQREPEIVTNALKDTIPLK